MMKRILFAVGLFLTPFVLLFGFAAVSMGRLIWKARKLSWKPHWKVIFWARIWSLLYRVPWAMAEGILHNEGASTRGSDGDYPLGDTKDSRGPSVGPGQVLRANVVRLWGDAPTWLAWFVTSKDPTDLAKAGNERKALWASVKVMREALDAHPGDVKAATAAYNGSGSAAASYAANAASFESDLKAA